MEITSANATSVAQLVNSPQPAPQTQPVVSKPTQASQPANQSNQESSVVTLSAQALQLNRAEQNVNTERAEVRPQEIKEPPGIQFMAGDDKGVKNSAVNTYA